MVHANGAGKPHNWIFDCSINNAYKQLEEGWNTDSSEEEFAQQLAEKLMEEAGNGPANFDDEDPDMEGWSDMGESGDEDDEAGDPAMDNDKNIDYSGMDGIEEAPFDSDEMASDGIDDEDDDADAFMDSDMSDDDSDSGDGLVPSSLGNGEHEDGDEDDISDDDGFPAALLIDEDSDSGHEGSEAGNDGKKKKEKYLEGFADAADYQHLIGQGWDERKRGTSYSIHGNEDHAKRSSSETRSQRRRKRRKGN